LSVRIFPGSLQTVQVKFGGADGIRTHDLLDAIEARSQLRHGPTETFFNASTNPKFRPRRPLNVSGFGTKATTIIECENRMHPTRITPLLEMLDLQPAHPESSETPGSTLSSCERRQDSAREKDRPRNRAAPVVRFA
jgi:hypothetical protein